MVQLADADIATREVLEWKGLHLFHFMGSSCSQKTRIFLNLKGIAWESHILSLGGGENYSAYYLGINPRGLVPALVIDGQVHIESNDIMTLLDQRFPELRLIPEGREGDMDRLLHHEDDLHHDVRTITFRFTQARGRAPRCPRSLPGIPTRPGQNGVLIFSMMPAPMQPGWGIRSIQRPRASQRQFRRCGKRRGVIAFSRRMRRSRRFDSMAY